MKTLWDIASAIDNHLKAGLKGTANEPYSIDQIIDECLNLRAKFIQDLERSGNITHDLVQSLSCIELDCKDVSMCCGLETYDKKLHFKIPQPISFVTDPIKYVGLTDRSLEFDIIRGNTWNVPVYNKYLKNKPRVWFAPNRQDGFILNPPTEDLKYITVDFIPENPTDLYQYGCCPVNGFEDDAISIPDWMQQDIIVAVIQLFTNTMYRIHGYKRNDQTGH